MNNTVSFTVTTDDHTAHKVTLTQDDATPTTIHGLFDTLSHDLEDCTASADGKSIKGDVHILFFTDGVSIDLVANRFTVEVEEANFSMNGQISTIDSNAVTVFVLTCNFPAK